MEDFSSRFTLAQAIKRTCIIHALILLLLFFFNFQLPQKSEEKDKHTTKHEQATVIIQADKQKIPQPAAMQAPLAVTQALQKQPQTKTIVTSPHHAPTAPLQKQMMKTHPQLAMAQPISQPHKQEMQVSPQPSADKQEARPETIQEAELTEIAEKAPVVFDTSTQHPKSNRPRSFSDLAQGFMQHVRQQEQESSGAENGSGALTQARVQEIIHDAYHAKVYALLRQAVNAERPQLYIHNTSQEQATLQLKIARNGHLISALIMHPCQSNGVTIGTLAHDLQIIQETLGRIAKSVGFYPALPVAFKGDTITISFPIGISTQQGFFSYFMT